MKTLLSIASHLFYFFSTIVIYVVMSLEVLILILTLGRVNKLQYTERLTAKSISILKKLFDLEVKHIFNGHKNKR